MRPFMFVDRSFVCRVIVVLLHVHLCDRFIRNSICNCVTQMSVFILWTWNRLSVVLLVLNVYMFLSLRVHVQSYNF